MREVGPLVVVVEEAENPGGKVETQTPDSAGDGARKGKTFGSFTSSE